MGYKLPITGSKNIKHTCSDFERPPLWTYLKEFDFDTGIFESGIKEEESLIKGMTCGDKTRFSFDDIIFNSRGECIAF